MKYLMRFETWQKYQEYLGTNPKVLPTVVYIENSGARVDAPSPNKYDPEGPCWIYTVDNDNREIN